MQDDVGSRHPIKCGGLFKTANHERAASPQGRVRPAPNGKNAVGSGTAVPFTAKALSVLFKVHDAMTPPGAPDWSALSVKTNAFVPESQAIATSILVREAWEPGIKAIAIELKAPVEQIKAAAAGGPGQLGSPQHERQAQDL